MNLGLLANECVDGAWRVSGRFLALFVGGLLTLFTGELHSADPVERVVWQTDRELTQQLALPVSLQWERVTLRQAIGTLSRTQRVAVLIDRRVDPDQLIKFEANQVSLEKLFDQLAESLGIGASRLGNVVYLGPRDVAGKLRTLSALNQAQLNQQPAIQRVILAKNAAWRWDLLARPRELLEGLAKEAGIEFDDVEPAVPHDLWASADLPPLAWYDRALLVAVQFDRTLEFRDGGKRVALIAVPDRVQIEKSYSPGKDAQATLAKYRELAPDTEMELVAGKIIVRGRVEDHARLASSPNTPPPVKGAVQVYSLTLAEVPLDKLLEALSQRLMLKFDYDREKIEKAGIKLDQRVSIKVEQQPLEVLLRAALEPAGLAFRRVEQTVEIFVPAKKP
jgi:hypothetical protein